MRADHTPRLGVPSPAARLCAWTLNRSLSSPLINLIAKTSDFAKQNYRAEISAAIAKGDPGCVICDPYEIMVLQRRLEGLISLNMTLLRTRW